MFNRNILQINENETLFINHREIAIIMKIIRNKKKQFSMHHEKLQISNEYIDEYIKEHHDELLQNHIRISKILQLLRQYCQFSHMRKKVETYIKKCHNCQRNKHATHAKYEKIQYQNSSIML